MRDNSANLDREIKLKYETSKQLIEQKKYRDAAETIKELIDITEHFYQNKNTKLFSFNHILETYYYAYFFKDMSKLNYTEYNINAFYRLYGFVLLKLGRNNEAIQAYNKGLEWNPVDLDTYFQLAELYKKTGNLAGCKKVTMESYRLCSTRATMARFYRNLGFYYLEKQELGIATVLYYYSNIYFETENANNELDYIYKATKKAVPNYELSQIHQILNDHNIPISPDADTIGITYRVGQIELEQKNTENAIDCFTRVYDLTQDEDVKSTLMMLGVTV